MAWRIATKGASTRTALYVEVESMDSQNDALECTGFAGASPDGSVRSYVIDLGNVRHHRELGMDHGRSVLGRVRIELPVCIRRWGMKRGLLIVWALCAQVLVPCPARAAACCDWSKWLSPIGVAGSVVKTDQKAFAVGVMLDQPFEIHPFGVAIPLAVRLVLDKESIQRETEPGVYLDPPYFYRCQVPEAANCDYDGQAVEPFTAEAETQKRWYWGLYLMADFSRIRARCRGGQGPLYRRPRVGGGLRAGSWRHHLGSHRELRHREALVANRGVPGFRLSPAGRMAYPFRAPGPRSDLVAVARRGSSS